MNSVAVYREEDLYNLIYKANKKQTPLELLKSSVHVNYLKSYLNDLGTNFYLIERNYINYDYLADFSFYYSKNFTHYYNKCIRIHFFSYNSNDILKFKNDLSNLVITGLPNKTIAREEYAYYKNFWNDYYQGFIVVRPIPNTFWGYSILKHYNSNKLAERFDDQRIFWGVKDYIIHFKGNKIKIKKSLAFMSQDGNVAACATIAIWSMLQRAVENYFINLKSPSEITKDAEEIGFNGSRVFPNQGLDLAAMCRAIVRSNLAPEVRLFEAAENVFPVDEPNIKLRKIVNAYSRLKIPIILAVIIPFKDKEEGHALAICGHSIDDKPIKNRRLLISKENKIRFYSEKINKLFAHDDQLGPFSKITFFKNELVTDWSKDKDVIGYIRPLAIIAPVFQKVRIPYEDIEGLTLGVNEIIINIFDFLSAPLWNIQLYYSADFKEKIQKLNSLNNNIPLERDLRMCLLEESMPKYIWVTTLIYEDDEIIYFVYDATALRNTNSLLFSFSSNVNFWKNLIDQLGRLAISENENLELSEMLKESMEKFSRKIRRLYNKVT